MALNAYRDCNEAPPGVLGVSVRPMSEPWYRTAVFYEISVRSFFDSNGDGVGDLQGVIDKLDYVRDLGVGCIWIMPFMKSPLLDGGYDVSDFRDVLAEFGTLEDAKRLTEEVHARGMRIIGDIPLNHTSDAHPWFQEARRDPNSPKRDWFVWSDTDSKYSDVRVIFVDAEDSNWEWDEQAGAYYWHRFFRHQPDLNYDNPQVQEEMIDTVRFWLSLGFDGLRLDAIPTLFEREGTDCENLPETHEFIKRIRAMLDSEFPDAMLLAEAYAHPRQMVDYFGDGDECHMAFHFPLASDLFMSLKQADAASLRRSLTDTPAIPLGAQWGTFLRNHDELLIELLTPEEHDYMWQEYAPEPAMRGNRNIRRRLAPLLDGDRRKIQLLLGLTMSLPGSPYLYYGDEIGMGDDTNLSDRDGLRTPMQWSDGPTAGFSTASPDLLFLPVVSRPGYGADDVNVANQDGDAGSLLSWVRNLVAERKRHPVLGVGALELVETGHTGVFAYLRHGDEEILVAADFSGTQQQISAAVSGSVATDLLSGDRLPIEHGSVKISLSPFGFRWLRLS